MNSEKTYTLIFLKVKEGCYDLAFTSALVGG